MSALPEAPGGGRILVTGATSVVARFLLPRLVEAGFEVHALSRRPQGATGEPATAWHQGDLTALRDWGLVSSRAIHLAPLWVLPGALERLAHNGLRRLVALGSTSRFTKVDSGSAAERSVAGRLADAEAELASRCPALGVEWTVLRPTVIYAAGRDKSLSKLAAFIRRFGCLPLPRGSTGLRQPVHAEDVAGACLSALGEPRTHGRAYDLSGGETLAYREMVDRVFRGLGKPVRIVEVPAPLLRAAARAGSCLPGLGFLDAAMVDRLQQDLCFDHSAATTDFGYQPRRFAWPG